MISTVEQNKIVRSGDLGEEESFTIEATPEAFEILSSGLYSDVKTAVLRELGTNAADAHIAAGTPDLPFDVTLPTRFNPELRFRDYGLGLTEQEMHDVYRKYFRSSKNMSNAYTGQLGLGSKSPLALTDSFVVVSYVGNEKTTYTVFKNERGIPTLTKMLTEETDEKSGLEIIIGVDKYSTHEYAEKAAKVYRWFKVRPNVSPSLNYREPVVNLEHGNWKIVEKRDYCSYAIMGNIAYPIDFSLIDGYDDFSRYEMHIDFGIGDLDISASREKLQYTAKTKAAIKKVFDDIIQEQLEVTQKKLDAIDNWYDAVCEYSVIQNNLFSNTCKNLKYKGQKSFLNVGHIDLTIRSPSYDANYNLVDPGEKYDCDQWYNYYSKNKHANVTAIGYNPTSEFYINDLDKGVISRMNHYITGHNGYVYVFTLAGTQTKDELIEHLGINPDRLKLLSSLPEPPAAVPVIRSKTEKVVKLQYHRTPSYCWKSDTVKVEDTIYYVPILRYNIILNEKELYPYDFQQIHELLETSGLIPKDTTLYGVRTSFSKKGRKNWINVCELIKDNFDNLLVKHDIQNIANLIKTYDDVCYSSRYRFERLYSKRSAITNQEVLDVLDKYGKISKTHSDSKSLLDTFQKIAIMLGKEIVPVAEVIDLDFLIKKKPVLKHVEQYDWEQPEVIDYINS